MRYKLDVANNHLSQRFNPCMLVDIIGMYVINSVHTSSIHHIIDQAFPIFQRATLKNTGRPGYEAILRYVPFVAPA